MEGRFLSHSYPCNNLVFSSEATIVTKKSSLRIYVCVCVCVCVLSYFSHV